MHGIRRKLLSQNFLNNPRLVAKLVDSSSIGKNDLVLEIGPGGGIITSELVRKAGHVIAIELDAYWYSTLNTQFATEKKLTLYKSDFLTHPLPKLPYSVFANVPFAIEGKIIRKLLDDHNPPRDCYLVVMKELAQRLAAKQVNTLFATQYNPWFEFSIVHAFKRTDFTPKPGVDAVLFRFTRKQTCLLPFAQREKYTRFVIAGYNHSASIRNSLRRKFGYPIIDAALHRLSLSRKTKPSQLSCEQWVRLYIELNWKR